MMNERDGNRMIFQIPRTTEGLYALWVDHRDMALENGPDKCYMKRPGDLGRCPGEFSMFSDFRSFLEQFGFPVEFPVDENSGQNSGSDEEKFDKAFEAGVPVELETVKELQMNYPDGLSPVAQYMAGLSTEDTLQSGSVKSDSKAANNAAAHERAGLILTALRDIDGRLSEIDSTLEDVVDTLDDVVDSINNKKVERSDTFNITISVAGDVSKKDIEKAVEKAIQRARVQKARGRAGI